MNRIIIVATLIIAAVVAAVQFPGYQVYGTTQYAGLLLPQLSAYNIFIGDPTTLTPGNGFHLYELATGLFTDYAEKQRLIKVPQGHVITATNDGLPQFPDGTILVKTFYYFNDKRDPLKGKRLIETRLLIKNNGQWVAGTYVWNTAQTDAALMTGGSSTPVTWIDAAANTRTINYRIPASKDCASCHNANNGIMPIGIKVRNLNIDVVRNSSTALRTTINQLQYLQEAGIMAPVNPSHFSTLPAWQNDHYSLEERVRAYLDVNCAHCHSDAGSCANSGVRFAWEMPLADTRIADKRNRIVTLLTKGRMPRIGTTVVDTAALSLIKQYLQSY